MKKIISLFIIIVSVSSCSLFQETTSYDEIEVKDNNTNSEEVYVFDEANEVETETTGSSGTITSNEEIAKVEQEVSETITEGEAEVSNEIPIAKTIPVTEDVYNEPSTTTETYTTYEEYQDYSKQFYLQLGAFSTIERAERFTANSSSNVTFPLSIVYNSTTTLYVVRSTGFTTRSEVEEIRDDFRRRNIYKDAFIITE